MYVPCIFYSLLTTPTNAQHTHTHTHIYIYINNILYTVSTPTYFDAPPSSLGSPILLLC